MADFHGAAGHPAESWMLERFGKVPQTSLGWFRAGVGFYNKREYSMAIDCLKTAVDIDPNNYNAYQILARACIVLNRRDDAIEALKRSVQLNNASDWQLLAELTSVNAKQEAEKRHEEESGAKSDARKLAALADGSSASAEGKMASSSFGSAD